MSIKYDYYTGNPGQLMTSFKQSISRYANYSAYFKIGITNNPETRWSAHKRSNPEWDKMVVIYRSDSIKHVRQTECDLINHAWNKEGLWNDVGGGGGNVGEGPYYVYALIQRNE